jgi:hypothetical protein
VPVLIILTHLGSNLRISRQYVKLRCDPAKTIIDKTLYLLNLNDYQQRQKVINVLQGNSTVHQAQKPQELMSFGIKYY